MKKVLYVFLVFQVLSIMSCCSEDVTLIGAGELSANQEKYTREPINTIVGAFVLLNEMEFGIASNMIQNPFVSELQATSCGQVFLNEIDESSFVVTINKAFDFNGQSFAPGVNLMEIEGVLTEVEPTNFYIEFTSDFFDHADFLNEQYIFEVQFGTTDGRSYTNSIELLMEI